MGSSSVPMRHSLRLRLVAVSVVIEIVMLGLLLANSMRLMDAALESETQGRIEELAPLLNATVSARLFERDYATLNEILGDLLSGRHGSLRYVVVYDNRGEVFVKAGAVDPTNMPAIDSDIETVRRDFVFDQAIPLTLADERVGELRYGLSIDAFVATRDRILRQGIGIATLEVLLSFVLLGVAGYLLTRHIAHLLNATRTVAAGDYSLRIPVASRDEIGVLTQNFNAMTGAVRDRIEALRRSEQALFAEKERAVVTLHSIGDAVITTDMEAKVEYLNPVAEQLTGWSTEQARGRPLREVFPVIHETDRREIRDPVQHCLEENTVVTLQNHTLLLARDGREIPIQDSAAPIRDRDGRLLGAVLVFHDVSESRRMSRMLSYQATHDALTDLHNRAEFERQLGHLLESPRSTDQVHGLCYLDLDQFKIVNDTCGHMAGDELLRQLARVFKARIRDNDLIARLGGDEFGILLKNCPADRLRAIAESLREAVREFRFVWKDKAFEIGVSIGIVPIEPDGGGVSDVMAAADVACYVAKDRGRNQIHFYAPHDEAHARRRGEMLWSTRITDALAEGRFELICQRIEPVDIGRVGPSGMCEILLRMRDEQGQPVVPGAFIPAAERYLQMPSIDRWVVGTALKALRERPEDDVAYSINLSGQSLCDEEFLPFVLDALEHSEVEPRRLCFEITETTAIANMTDAMRLIKALRGKGCRFALDDFGSGLSSFAYLKSLPVDFLKIDGSFVRDVVEDKADRAMVRAINEIGHVMGIMTIAEFVESHTILRTLKEIGVDYAQGFGIHRPEPFWPLRPAA